MDKIEEDIEIIKYNMKIIRNVMNNFEDELCENMQMKTDEVNKAIEHILSEYKRVLKENEILKEEKEQAWEEWNNLEQGSYETELKLKEENRKLKAEMKDGVIAIKLYALQTENEKLKKKIDLMENYMVENGWEICFDNIYAELKNKLKEKDKIIDLMAERVFLTEKEWEHMKKRRFLRNDFDLKKEIKNYFENKAKEV